MGFLRIPFKGSLLFSNYINDLVSVVKHSRIIHIADDAKIYKEVTLKLDCRGVQVGLNNIVMLCFTNVMELNVSKCSALTFAW